MKANELMIGDWVQGFLPDTYSQVYGVINECRVAIVGGGAYMEVSNEDIQPIPLTAEILEKNGFDIAILNNKEPEAYLRMGYLDDDGEMEDVAYDIIIDHHKTYWELTIINNDKGCRIDININYVHELQHALKLCGIDKEIVL